MFKLHTHRRKALAIGAAAVATIVVAAPLLAASLHRARLGIAGTPSHVAFAIRIVGEGLGLDLSPQQQAAVQPVLLQAAQQFHALHNDDSLSAEQRKARAAQILTGLRTQLQTILNPEQQKKIGALLERWKSLGITADQKARFRAIFRETASQVRAAFTDSALPREQKKEKIMDLLEQAHSQARQVLTPEQQEQIAALPRGEFLANVLTAELDLSPEQQSGLKSVLEIAAGRVKATLDDGSLSRAQRADRLKEIHGTTRSDILALLTPAQQQKLQALEQQFRALHPQGHGIGG